MPISSQVYPEAPFAVAAVSSQGQRATQLIWGHGWGQSLESLRPLAESLKPFASSLLIDFPGFGKTPKPPDSWGTADYADQVAAWLRLFPEQKFVWIGHSFGGRIGLQLGARYPDLLAGMILIASAGIPRPRTPFQQLKVSMRRNLFKLVKRVLKEGPQLEALRDRMGSADYRSAGALRPIFTRVVGEDLTNQARMVQCPTLLLYGKNDTETPPELGQRLNGLIRSSELVILEGFGHLTILTDGRHQVALRIRKFLDSLT